MRSLLPARLAKSTAQRLTAASLLAGFAAGIDGTSTFIVFPAIRDDLANGDTASATWILTIVGITSAAVLLQAGRLADRFGHNRILVISALTATAASLLSAVAPTLGFLVGARGLQAAALAGLAVSSIAIVVRESEPSKLGASLGRWGFWTAVAGVLGPLLASVFVEFASWRWMFAFSAPIALAVALLALPSWANSHRGSRQGVIDYLGTLLAMGGVSLLVLALLEGNDWGWGNPQTIAALVASAAMLLAVVLRSRTHPDPILPLQLFRRRRFVLGLAIGFVSSIMFFGMWLALLSYATGVWEYGIIATAFILAIMPGTMVPITQPAGRTADRHGARGIMTFGALMFSAGFAATALLVGAEPAWPLLLPAVVAGGVGMGTILPNTMNVGTSALEPEVVGTGAALLQTTSRIGAGLGSALVVAILEAGTIGEVETHQRSLWLIVIAGLVTAVLCSFITPLQSARPPQNSHGPPQGAAVPSTDEDAR
ncbi:MAG: MFS transporter [Acidimicrobiales bacterium]